MLKLLKNLLVFFVVLGLLYLWGACISVDFRWVLLKTEGATLGKLISPVIAGFVAWAYHDLSEN